MKSRGKFSGSFLAGLLGLFIAIPVTAQEYDDMYFRKSDRKVKAADTEKVVSDKEATNPDLQRPAGSNINPDYLSRYDLVESDTTEGYFDEDYAADMSTQGQSGTTVINNYYGSGGLQSWDDIYWSDPFFYRNTVYDPFYRMRMRTWGTFYSWNRWYYYRPVVYSYGWGWGWGPTYYNGWNYAGAFYDPWYYNGFYSWNTCPFYPSYAYYGYNRYPGTWFYSSPYGYVTYVDQAGGRDITRGRRSSRSSIATGRYAGGGIASSAVSSRSSVRGGRVISSDAVPTRRTSSRVASSSTTSGRTAVRGGRTSSYVADNNNIAVDRSRGNVSSGRSTGYETRNLSTYSSRESSYYTADRSRSSEVRSSNAVRNAGAVRSGNAVPGNRGTVRSQNAYNNRSAVRSGNSSYTPRSAYSRTGTTTRSRSQSYQRSAVQSRNYMPASRSNSGTSRSYGNTSSRSGNSSYMNMNRGNSTNSSRSFNSSGSRSRGSSMGSSSRGGSSRGSTMRSSGGSSRSSGSSGGGSSRSRGSSGKGRGN